MPYYRNRGGYKSGRRSRYTGKRAVKKWVAKKRPVGSGQHGKRFFKLKTAFGLTANVGGDINLAVTDDVSAFGDWSSIAALFDTYKVAALKVKFIPSLPNDASGTTGFYPFYVVGDPNNNTTPVSSITTACQYENMKAMNMYRPWTYYYKCPTKTASAATETILTGGYRPTTATSAMCGIFGWGGGFDISQQYGSYIVTAYVVCKERR